MTSTGSEYSLSVLREPDEAELATARETLLRLMREVPTN